MPYKVNKKYNSERATLTFQVKVKRWNYSNWFRNEVVKFRSIYQLQIIRIKWIGRVADKFVIARNSEDNNTMLTENELCKNSVCSFLP